MKGPSVVGRPVALGGVPTKAQREALADYIACEQPMSIYGDSGIYRQLEARLSNIFQQQFCVLTNTGTSALNSGYFGLKIERGDEVIVPAYTFLATVTPLLRLGAKLIFCDADAQTGNLSFEDLQRKISPSTKAVSLTHMWGYPCNMEKIVPLVREKGVKLLEDCSHAHFTTYRGRLLGTFGDVACFSIGARKAMTSGEGGFFLTSDPEIFLRGTQLGHFAVRSDEALQRVRDLGWAQLAEQYRDTTLGFGENYRMHPYSAVMAYALLASGEMEQMLARRRESLSYFAEGLRSIPGICPPPIDTDYLSGAMYGFKAQIPNVSLSVLTTIVRELQQRQVEVKLPDSGLLPDQAVFRSTRGDTDNSFPGAEAYLRGRVSLPTFSGGLAQDRIMIDQYLETITYVLHEYAN